MQRLITVMVALLSFIAANLIPACAQRTPNDNPALIAPIAGVLELPADRTVPALVVRDTKFVLAGHVSQDVLAINCQVTIARGASVGNYLTAIGGSVHDESAGRVRFIQQSDALLADLKKADAVPQPQITFTSGSLRYPLTSPQPDRTPTPAKVDAKPDNWVGGQFNLFLVGLLSFMIAMIVGPRATERTGELLHRDPARCLVVGTLGMAIMLLTLGIACGLMHTPLGILATPLGTGYGIVCLGVLLFGWVCGVRYSGQWMAHRLRRTGTIGLILQFALGISAFFVVNSILGSLNHGLGVMGLFVQLMLALMGLGAALLSGFGADPNWLTARIRGEVHWLSRTPRL